MYAPASEWFATGLVHLYGSCYPSSKPGAHPEPPSAQSSFARPRCYLGRRDVKRLVSGRYSAFIATTNSRAGPTPSFRLDFILERTVFAGWRQPLLGIGPSRRYLRSLCQGARTHTPQRSLAHSAYVFRDRHQGHRPRPMPARLGTPDDPCPATSTGGWLFGAAVIH